MADQLTWLMDWYTAQCDGEWEHHYGVTIGTLDNPGWSLAVDLDDTPFATHPFEPVSHNVSDEEAVEGPSGDKSWWVCKVEDNTFKCFGGPRDLGNMIAVFRQWIEALPAPADLG